MRSTIKCDIMCLEIFQFNIVKDGVFMKTKIIYISGSEIFDMQDVRSAFETVRRELGLAQDTILFGVPVDADDALDAKQDSNVCDTTKQVEIPQDNVPEPVSEPVVEVCSPLAQEMPVEKEIEKPKRTRKTATKKSVATTEVMESGATATDTVVPILSVLGRDTVATSNEQISPLDDDATSDMMDDNVDLASITDATEPVIDIAGDDILDAEPQFEIGVPSDFVDTDINEEIPVTTPEFATVSDADDGLEKLLQSVQSLHEDEHQTAELHVVENDIDETDATLEKLANEFAENQDKIVNTTKGVARGGRIGKLKNILPFKKAKHNESGLMGDLFGWAGVAANDEEFGLPEFFPTVAKK